MSVNEGETAGEARPAGFEKREKVSYTYENKRTFLNRRSTAKNRGTADF